MRAVQFRALTALAAAGLASLAWPGAQSPAGAAAAKNGSVSGTVAGPLPKKGAGEATVFATRLADGTIAAAAPVRAKGAFKVSLPAGGYALSTVVIGKPGSATALRTQRTPVTLKAGQRRSKVAVKVKKSKARKSALATRAYVQESGKVTPGVTAFTIEPFADGTGDWSFMGRGLTDLLMTDLLGETPCPTAIIANSRDRKFLEAELEFQKSKWVDPTTRVKRNFILADLVVTGGLTTAPDGQSSAVQMTITDARTGKVVDTIDATLRTEGVFDQAEQLAKTLGERICQRPAAYKLTLAVDGRGEFATHSATGRIDSELTAIRSGGAAGAPATSWSGLGALQWANLAFSSKTDCSYGSAIAPSITWSAQLSVVGERDVKLDWSWAGNDSATTTVTCPGDPPAVVPGQPGPALLQMTPLSTVLPLQGGQIPLTGGFTSGGDGFTNTGTLLVTPIWTTAPPA